MRQVAASQPPANAAGKPARATGALGAFPDELAAQVEGTVSAREVDQLVAGASPGRHGRSHPT
jgi:hypothetical protein